MALEQYFVQVHALEDELCNLRTRVSGLELQLQASRQEAVRWRTLANERLESMQKLGTELVVYFSLFSTYILNSLFYAKSFLGVYQLLLFITNRSFIRISLTFLSHWVPYLFSLNCHSLIKYLSCLTFSLVYFILPPLFHTSQCYRLENVHDNEIMVYKAESEKWREEVSNLKQLIGKYRSEMCHDFDIQRVFKEKEDKIHELTVKLRLAKV